MKLFARKLNARIAVCCQSNSEVAPAAAENAWSKGKPDFVPAEAPKENVWEKRRKEQTRDKGNGHEKDCSLVFIILIILQHIFSGNQWHAP